jgi:hypothetical protein
VENSLERIKSLAERDFYPWAIESLTVETDEQEKNVSDILTIGKRLKKDADEQRMVETLPHREAEKAVNEKWKPIINRLTMAVNKLDAGLIDYRIKKKKEADELLLMQMQEQAARLSEAKETGEIIENEVAIVQSLDNKVRGNMSTTSIKETPEFDVIEPDKVERSLCSPDLKKIKARYDSGIKDIPGVLVTIKRSTVSRFS